MGFGLTQSVMLYIIVMVIVIAIGIGIVVGGNPLRLLQKQKLSELFKPGQAYVLDPPVEQYTRLDCAGTYYKLILDNIKFEYKGKPADSGSKVSFMVVLDHDRKLFLGRNEDETEKILECTTNGDVFDCPNTDLHFILRGIGAPDQSQKESYHFTIWQHREPIKAALADSTLDRLLTSYSEYYLSSFDSTIEVKTSCAKYNCESQEKEGACREKNNEGCYWGGNWGFGDCKYCPAYTECTKYNAPQCTQCPIAFANCRTEGVLFESCVPK